ncbi:MAG: DUF2127 domain-containing protein [Gammaproteobacteria bacterium]|nr:DUF2127 domain-containing protein [Gammaproteobacteria bacterium]
MEKQSSLNKTFLKSRKDYRRSREIWKEKNLHLAFEITLILKGIFALLEILGGLLAYFITQQFLLGLVVIITQEELTEDPRDFVARYLLQSAQHFSISSQHFTSLYLLSHGVIKILLVAGLLREKLWFYPLAIAVFLFFILYQLFRFSVTHSPWLLAITLLDIIVIWLTWHEYRYLRRHRSAALF